MHGLINCLCILIIWFAICKIGNNWLGEDK